MSNIAIEPIVAPVGRDESHHADAEVERARWETLCGAYLPIDQADSIWRYSRPSRKSDADQGWKLHVSATILSANMVFEKVAPYLKRQGVLFKAPSSLLELAKLNSGLHYGYCQVGKFITVYPRHPGEAVTIARQLHRLTRRLRGPSVPFDSRFRADSCIYYRYGSFRNLEIEDETGGRVSAMRDHQGQLVPDLRYSESAKPAWIEDPFVTKKPESDSPSSDSPLKTTFRAFQSLTQRGKGGVYKAFDFSVSPPRLCLLKEGRMGGEVGWDGRDGGWLVRHEEQVLGSLRRAGIDVPEIYSSFELKGNCYLVTEFVEGRTLHDFLTAKQKRLSVTEALRLAIDLAAIVFGIHAAGWAWRDCKPANIIITKEGKLRPVDFEGACSIDRPAPRWWSTPAFAPWETPVGEAEFSSKDNDLFALGVGIYFLLAGRLPEGPGFVPPEKRRRNIPPDVCALIRELLGGDSKLRPEARQVLRRLQTAAR
jgi:hypothetical protein